MNYIVLDLEWNQEMFETHKLRFEIIEIGAVKLDDNFQIVSRFSSLIHPNVHKKMNPHIQKITGISYEELENAPSFLEVIREFAEWCGENPFFCTFGNQDLIELQHNLFYYDIQPEELGLPWKFPLKYIDVQRVYSVFHRKYINREEKITSLENALMDLQIKTEKNFHRALEDAEYTAILMAKMEEKASGIHQEHLSLEHLNIPQGKRDEQEVYLGDMIEFITCGYEEKEELLLRKDILNVRCVECRNKCRKKIRWFSDNAKHVCVAVCKTHGYLMGNLYFRVNPFSDTQKHYVIRRVWGITEEEYEKVVDRTKLLRERRRQKRQRQKINQNHKRNVD
jgi:DNA polymerase III epsilon subunit-like protein